MGQQRPSVFVIAALVSGTCAYSASVWAGWTRHSVTGCGSFDPQIGVTIVAWNRGDVAKEVFCVVPDSEERPAVSLNGVGVFFFDASTRGKASLSLCSVSPRARSASCRLEAVDDGPDSEVNDGSLFAPATFWANRSGEFKLLKVSLPAIDEGRFSHLNGYTTF